MAVTIPTDTNALLKLLTQAGLLGTTQKAQGGTAQYGPQISSLNPSQLSSLEPILNTLYGAENSNKSLWPTQDTQGAFNTYNAAPGVAGSQQTLQNAELALGNDIGAQNLGVNKIFGETPAQYNSAIEQAVNQKYAGSGILGNTAYAGQATYHDPSANGFNLGLAATLFAAPELAALAGIGGVADAGLSAADAGAQAAAGIANGVAGTAGSIAGADAGLAGSAGLTGALGAATPTAFGSTVAEDVTPALAGNAGTYSIPLSEAAADTGTTLGSIGGGALAAGGTGGAAAGGGGLSALLSSLGSSPLSTASLLSSAISGGSGIIGSLIGANAQKSAASSASNTEQNMFNQIMQNLSPYMQTGAAANNSLAKLTGAGTANPLTSPLLAPPTSNLSEQALQATPGYQFNLTQGLKAVNNSAAARGLANSGAALKGASNYATGEADQTYQNQFNNSVTNQTNQFNRLLTLAQQGQSAATGAGGFGTQTASNIGSNTIGAGNATAGAAGNAANAIGTAANQIPNSLLLNQLLSQNQNNGLYAADTNYINNYGQNGGA